MKPDTQAQKPEQKAKDKESTPPDMALGVALASIPEKTPFACSYGGAPVILVRTGDSVVALAGKCTHYGAPLCQGHVVDGQVSCPWHHARFGVSDGRALRGPALAPLTRYRVRNEAGHITLAGPVPTPVQSLDSPPPSISIIGGGAGGLAAVCELRQRGYGGQIAVFSSDTERPYDRTKLSKSFLAGAVGEDGLQLNVGDTNLERATTWRLGTEVARLDLNERRLIFADGQSVPYHAAIVATGASANRPALPGAHSDWVQTLRSAQDARRLRKRLASCRKVVVVGAGFIGMEAAAAMRQYNVDVTVVTPDGVPFKKVLGEDVGAFIRHVHEKNGVHFHVGEVEKFDAGLVHIKAKSPKTTQVRLPADLVVLGTGVSPNVAIAQKSGLSVDDGILVNGVMRTSNDHVYAVGDVANFCLWGQHDNRTRIEHWALAQNMGKIAANAILGDTRQLTYSPFFWTEHFGNKLRYVGHQAPIGKTQLFGDLHAGKAAVAYQNKRGDVGAVMTLGADELALAAEEILDARSGDVLKRLRQHFS